MLMQIGNVKLFSERDLVPVPIGPNSADIAAKQAFGFGQLGIGEIRLRQGKQISKFPVGTKLSVFPAQPGKKNPATLAVVHFPTGAKDVWRVPHFVAPRVSDLSGQPKYFKVKNTVKEAMIGREVLYWSAATSTQQINQHRWWETTWSVTNSCSPGTVIDDWSGNNRMGMPTVSSWTNTGSTRAIDKIELLISTGSVIMSDLTVSFSVANGITADFTWTHYIYNSAGVFTKQSLEVMLGWLFNTPSTSAAVGFCQVFNGATATGIQSDNISLVADPATGNLDGNWDDTYTDWNAAGVVNDTGSDQAYDTIRVWPSSGVRHSDLAVTPGTWTDAAAKDIAIRYTWSEIAVP